MTTAEFEQIAEKLAALEDFLRDQARLARSVNHTADARAFESALLLTIQTHALTQLLLEK